MSCWVVPMVAAEMWGIPVDHVLARIRSGELTSKAEGGFLFVDVAPDSPQIETPKFVRSSRPPTYIAVTGAELAALNAIDHPEDQAVSGAYPQVAEQFAQRRAEPLAVGAGIATAVRESSDAGDDPTPDSFPIEDWRAGRAIAARSRRGPGQHD